MSLVLEWRTGQVTFARRTLLPCQPYHWRCPSHIWIYHQISSVTRQNSFPYHIWQEMSRASVSSASMLRFHQMLFIVWDGFVCLSINWPILVDWDWMFLPFMDELPARSISLVGFDQLTTRCASTSPIRIDLSQPVAEMKQNFYRNLCFWVWHMWVPWGNHVC